MSTLHTVNKSPFERVAMASCLAHLSAGDAVLLIEDGVVGARKGGAFAKPLRRERRRAARSTRSARISTARGVKPKISPTGVEIVDYDGFVDLAAQHARVCAWL